MLLIVVLVMILPSNSTVISLLQLFTLVVLLVVIITTIYNASAVSCYKLSNCGIYYWVSITSGSSNIAGSGAINLPHLLFCVHWYYYFEHTLHMKSTSIDGSSNYCDTVIQLFPIKLLIIILHSIDVPIYNW